MKTLTKSSTFIVVVMLSLVLSSLISEQAYAGNKSFLTYHGRILKSDGSPVSGSSVAMSIQILEPGGCMLWQETLAAQDFSTTKGVFSVSIGSGANTAPGALTWDQVFQNGVALGAGALTGTGCTGTFTGAATDDRTLYMTFDEGSGNQTVGPVAIKTIANNAMFAGFPFYGVPSNGQAITYNSAQSRWEPTTLGGGSGTVTSVTSANTDMSVATTTTTPVITLNSGTTGGAADANKIAKLDAGGLLTVAMLPTVTVAKGGTGLTSGTSGGVPYFSAAGTMASSAALTQFQVVLGGGAGGAPTVVAGTGTSGQVLTSNGAGVAPTWQAAAAGDITDVVAGTALTGGATSGSATLNVDVGLGANKIPQVGGAAITGNSVILSNGTGNLTSQSLSNGQIIIGSTGLAPVAANITGTANQVAVTNGAGSITLSTPQDIATTSTPTFATPTAAGHAVIKSYADGNLVGKTLAAPAVGQNGQSIRWNNGGNTWEYYSTSSVTPALSSLTAATATNTIDSLNFAQNWNWSTATTQSPMSISANALTTGSLLNLTTSNATVNSTNGLLYVANTGASTSGMVARIQSNSTAGSGMTVLADGRVSIDTTPVANTMLSVATLAGGQTAISGTGSAFGVRGQGDTGVYGSSGTGGKALYASASGGSYGVYSVGGTNYFQLGVGIGKATALSGTLDVKGSIVMSGSTSGYAGFQPAAVAGSTVWTLPVSDGTANQVLKTDGAGILGWATAASGESNTASNVGVGGVGVFKQKTGVDLEFKNINGSTLVSVANDAGNNEVDISMASIAANTMLANATGGAAAPTAVSLSAMIDSAISSTQGSVLYRNGASWVALAPGTSGQFLQTQGAAANPQWATAAGAGDITDVVAGTALTGGATSGSATLNVDVGLGANKIPQVGAAAITANSVILSNGTGNLTHQALTNGQIIIGATGVAPVAANITGTANQVTVTNGAGSITLATPQDIATTSSPTFNALTLTTALTVANGGTGITSGTSGGVPYFSAAGTMASSAALTQYQVVLGGGAGGAPTVVAGVGTSGQILTSNGAGAAPTWQAAASGGGALSAITAATATNTIDSLNFAQIWNWSTATTQTAMSMNANALTTGSMLSLATSNASVNSTNGLLYVANTSAGTSGTVARIQSNSTAGSGLTVLANGNVGVGTSSPSANVKLHVVDTVTNGADPVFSVDNQAASGSWIPVFGGHTPNMTAGGMTQFAFGRNGSSGNRAEIQFYYAGSGSSSNRLDFGFWANNEVMSLLYSGNVGVGTNAPRAKLDVNGTVLFKASVSNAASPIDFSTGNLQHTAANCGAFALHNMQDGGSYTFAVKGATSATCSFTAFTDAGVTGLTVHMPSDHAATTASKHTLYSFIVMGTDVYVTWLPDL